MICGRFYVNEGELVEEELSVPSAEVKTAVDPPPLSTVSEQTNLSIHALTVVLEPSCISKRSSFGSLGSRMCSSIFLCLLLIINHSPPK